MKTDEQRAIAWLLSEDTGTSSTSILAHMLGEHYEDVDAPHDPSDLGRCVRLLALFPAWVPRMGEMAKYGPAWAGLVEDWQKIVDLYHAESAQHSESRQPSLHPSASTCEHRTRLHPLFQQLRSEHLHQCPSALPPSVDGSRAESGCC